MTNRIPDFDLLDRTIEKIAELPVRGDSPAEGWNQEVFRCGTGMCLAGHVAEDGGGEWVRGFEDGLAPVPEDDPSVIHLLFGGTVNGTVFASDRAQRLLRLNDAETEELFAAGNTLDGLMAIRDRLKEEYGIS